MEQPAGTFKRWNAQGRAFVDTLENLGLQGGASVDVAPRGTSGTPREALGTPWEALGGFGGALESLGEALGGQLGVNMEPIRTNLEPT